MTQHSYRRREDGYSLVEVMIAVALAAFAALVATNLTELSNAMFGNSKALAGKQALETAIRRTISSSDTCSAAMATPQTMNPPSATAPGTTDLSMTIDSGGASDVVVGGADLRARYDVRIAPDGLRFVVPQGAVPVVSGPESVWTGVLQLGVMKTQKSAGGDKLGVSPLATMRMRVNTATNAIVGCESDDTFTCPDGFVQTGLYPTDCKTPQQLLSEVCHAGEVPVSNGVSIDCKDPRELFTDLCPTGTVPVTTTGDLECRSADTLTVICGPCQIPIPGATGMTCETVPNCGGPSAPAVALCGLGSCSVGGETKYDTPSAKLLECDGSCWQEKSTTLSCLPPNQIKKGDDEWMKFHQDTSMRRPFGSPCEPGMRSSSKHASMVNGGTRIKFDDTSKVCATDKSCIEVPK